MWGLGEISARAGKPFNAATRVINARLAELEARRSLPGTNTPELNRRIWSDWDWSQGGEEWTPSEAWKQSFVDEVIAPHIRGRGRVLEVGPGAGRWSVELRSMAGHLILVDLSERCIALCKERLAGADAEFHVNDGTSLPFVETATVDAVFSYDVFVHIAPHDTASYLREFARVLVPGGVGVIHHANRKSRDGWRSGVTAESFRGMASDAGLNVVRQFDAWGPNGEFDVRRFGDMITVFSK